MSDDAKITSFASKKKHQTQKFIRKIVDLRANRQWEDALKLAEGFVSQFPESTLGLSQWWNILMTLGDGEAALDLLSKQEQKYGLGELLFSHYISSLHASSAATRDEIRAAHRVFSGRFFPKGSSAHPLPVKPIQRIGLLSREMRYHASASFLYPLLNGLAETGVDILAYSTSPIEDRISDKFKDVCSSWHNLHSISSQDAARQIQSDKPDFLINCEWHLPHTRLDISRFLPEVPQIDYLQAGTSGIPQIPFNLTDETLNPRVEGEFWLGQKCLYLDGGSHVFEPLVGETMEPNLQRDWKGEMVIGSCNHLSKLNDTVIRCWSEILKLNGRVKLLLKAANLDLPEIQKRILARFLRHGINAERLIFHGFTPNHNLHYQILNQLSIALDPFPYNGVTTTCDALWMGVPVVTLFGDRPIARKASSLLGQIGADELITYDEEGYVEKVTDLINDKKRLIGYHQTLRSQMIASPLCNRQRLARDFNLACSG